MRRVAHEHDPRRLAAQFPDVRPALLDLAAGVVIVATHHMDEEVADVEFPQDNFQRLVLVRRKHRLGKARGAHGVEHAHCRRLKVAFPAAPFVLADELGAQHFETLLREIEAQPAVILDHREVKKFLVALRGQQRQPAAAEQAVHDVHIQPGIVEQRTVPVPDHMEERIQPWKVRFVHDVLDRVHQNPYAPVAST